MTRLLISAFFALWLVGAHAAPKTKPCDRKYAEIVNENARLDPENYGRPNHRDIEKVERFLGSVFSEKRKSLKPGQRWTDSGGGYGIAGIQTANATGAKVEVLNAQNFWRYFEDGLHDANTISEIAEYLGVSLSGIPMKKGASVNGPFYYVDLAKFQPRHEEILKKRVLAVVNKAKKSGNFNYRLGFAEETLPQIEGKSDLLSDLYGAFFYSDQRTRLLDGYYESLTPDGLGAIRLGTSKYPGLMDKVVVKGRQQTLGSYLVERFPTVFSFDPTDPLVLVMRKDPKIESMDLQSLLKPIDTQIVQFEDTTVPQVTWAPAKRR